MIFKGVRDGKPYPEHGLSYRDWSRIPPRQIRLDELVTTTTVLALDRLLSEDSTFYGDLFPHAVKWHGIVYLEDGLHRAVRAALRNMLRGEEPTVAGVASVLHMSPRTLHRHLAAVQLNFRDLLDSVTPESFRATEIDKNR